MDNTVIQVIEFNIMDNGCVMRAFFPKISQIIGRFGQMGQMNCGMFIADPNDLSM